ncbi:hypothetical protein MJD09_10670 [bacterium]|nr:hypothetical protein [bacterium]
MLTVKGLRCAILLLIITCLYPQAAPAESFKSADFLTWKRDTQDFYIEASVGMASLIATQNDRTQAKCIDDWYYTDEAAANAFVLSVMRDHPTYHPRGIILGVVQKQCGSFKNGEG